MITVRKSMFPVLALFLLLGGGVACEREGPMERAGEKIDDAAERAGDKIEKATD